MCAAPIVQGNLKPRLSVIYASRLLWTTLSFAKQLKKEKGTYFGLFKADVYSPCQGWERVAIAVNTCQVAAVASA